MKHQLTGKGGKGSAFREVDQDKFNSNFDRIFGTKTKPANQCQGCQAGWDLVEHKPWPKDSEIIQMHKVEGGYEGELVVCTKPKENQTEKSA